MPHLQAVMVVVQGFGIRSLRIILASYSAVLVGLVWNLALGLWLVLQHRFHRLLGHVYWAWARFCYSLLSTP
ncbi:hypothetical protein [Agarivorans gilvus]|jgi:hypothetical protein|uniref:hypothetical protein n=1 Tax=Agarivorans gilvus TaxID=680279 RepID=UPI0006EBF8D9|nr:hypothetical protein [Agarivorans gilvus]